MKTKTRIPKTPETEPEDDDDSFSTAISTGLGQGIICAICYWANMNRNEPLNVRDEKTSKIFDKITEDYFGPGFTNAVVERAKEQDMIFRLMFGLGAISELKLLARKCSGTYVVKLFEDHPIETEELFR